MTRMTRQQVGKQGEEWARAYLAEKDYQIIASNWRCRLGELDIVARDRTVVVFVEVRTRIVDQLPSSDIALTRQADVRYGSPEQSVTAQKQSKLRLLANAFLQYKQWHDAEVRFDVIAIRIQGDAQRLNGMDCAQEQDASHCYDIQHTEYAF